MKEMQPDRQGKSDKQIKLASVDKMISLTLQLQNRLPREFFTMDAITLSKKLLGKVLVHQTSLGLVRGIITETEAYMGVDDKGSHTYGGKRTNRTEPMFHIGGTSYVYLIYGMYPCVNITAGEEDIPMASLIRMVEPADEKSYEIMKKLRLEKQMEKYHRKLARKQAEQEKSAGSLNHVEICNLMENTTLDESQEIKKQQKNINKHLADGPGKMCVAMNITKEDNNLDTVTSDILYLTEGLEIEEKEIQIGKRIGIDYAEEAADYLWRFTLA